MWKRQLHDISMTKYSRMSSGKSSSLTQKTSETKPKRPSTPSGHKTPKSESSLSSIDALEKEQVKKLVKHSSLDYIRQSLSGSADIIAETLMEGDDNGESGAFGITLPAPPSTAPTRDPEQIAPVQEIDTLTWYPYYRTETPKGHNTRLYLEMLTRTREAELGKLELLRSTEEVGKTIGCLKTLMLWEQLNSIFRYMEGSEFPDIISDLCYYMTTCPDSIEPYLKCLNRVKPYLHNPGASIKLMEEKASAMANIFSALIDEGKAHQDESIKFAEQVSNVSANLAGLQEVLEQTVIKVSKLDLLPGDLSPPASGVSIPSTSRAPEGTKVKEVSFKEPGEYRGHYHFKVQDGKIKSIIPPRGNPEIEKMLTYHPDVQKIFVNLDQQTLINKLNHDPSHKTAFTAPQSMQRSELLRALCRGVPKTSYQWIKSTSPEA
ncbi:putative polymerase co-factor [Lasius neglectus virus 2]|uniref:Putative polymerase co-factor n=1 Tax=Lasius neglectus virus 2 TaxID=2170211 RepID=A0A3G5FMC7_9VIRU|nr:putative polymerase co-factor [Lasius neglectus virus 2]AYW51540.1 putative polymerase co-factor [Lasius neglectus virus 2]UXD80028.1 putative polymerase co-factor [Lasius neglectus virus 2]